MQSIHHRTYAIKSAVQEFRILLKRVTSTTDNKRHLNCVRRRDFFSVPSEPADVEDEI